MKRISSILSGQQNLIILQIDEIINIEDGSLHFASSNDASAESRPRVCRLFDNVDHKSRWVYLTRPVTVSSTVWPEPSRWYL